jgi:hypothetical protein
LEERDPVVETNAKTRGGSLGTISRQFPIFRERTRKGQLNIMKLSKISRSALAGMALLLATSAFAASKANRGSFELSEPLTVSGHDLQPGQYKVTWEGTDGDVQAMILSHGKLVATVPAHLTELNQPERNDAVVSRKNDDGSHSLTQVDFAGKKYALSFDNEGTNTGATSSAGIQ